jgi:hypothetical protein
MAEKDVLHTLTAYQVAAESADGVNLPAFVEAHSEHYAEVLEYASYQYVFERGAVYNAEVAAPQFEANLLARAESVRARMQKATQAARAIISIVESAKHRGLAVPELAQRLRLSALEITKLNQRLIRPETIPAALVSRLAEVLNQSVEAVAQYLRFPPTLSAQASYKSEAAPRIAEQIDFADALESSRALSAEDRAYWKEQVEG